MKQNRGILIILALVLFIVLGGTFFYQAWNTFVDDANKVIKNETFTTIEVVSDNASVEIMPTDSTTTTVEYIGKKRKNDKYNFNVDVKNDTLTIEFKEKRWSFLRFDFSFSKMELLVKVPETQYDLVKVKNNNGKIKTEKSRTQRKFRLKPIMGVSK